MKTLLVPIDFSEVTSDVIDKSIDIAQKFNSKLWLVHVAPPEPDYVGYQVGPQYIRDTMATTLKTDHKQLQELSTKIKDIGLASESLLMQGDVGDLILEKAFELDADMIIMGSHGHGLLYSAVVGSVCHEVLNHAKIPVLVIPSKFED